MTEPSMIRPIMHHRSPLILSFTVRWYHGASADALGGLGTMIPVRKLSPAARALCFTIMIGSGIGFTQTKGLGIFTNEGSVGQTPPGCKSGYDAGKGEYRITGGGANMWNAVDAFYFVWKKVSGDMTLTADVQWVGTSTV